MAGYRPEYTWDEETKIVNYIVKKGYIHRIKGDKMWIDMANEQIVDRTWHSLKQHFRKFIIKQLDMPHYMLDKKTVDLFRKVFNKKPKWVNKQKTSSDGLKANKEDSGRPEIDIKRRKKTAEGVVIISDEEPEKTGEGRENISIIISDSSSCDED